MNHQSYLNKAFILAKMASPKQVRPNPLVGAIVVDKNNEILGEGYHQVFGGPHAEVFAIQAALKKTSDLTGTTLYVTLEPCSHHGKTPPCVELIMQHKIGRVVIGSIDPNPIVSGIELLKQSGVEVLVVPLPIIEQMNAVFMTNQLKKRPFIQIKIASTIDGKISDQFGNSKWITNQKSRLYVHEVLRDNTDAILTTAKTVILDRATLDIRVNNQPSKELNAIIIDRTGELLQSENQQLPIFYKRNVSKVYLLADTSKINHPYTLPSHTELIDVSFDNQHMLQLDGLGEQLMEKGIHHIMTEAGSVLNSFLIENNWADEMYCFIAPLLLIDDKSKSMLHSQKLVTLDNAHRLTLIETQIFEGDVLLRYSFGASVVS